MRDYEPLVIAATALASGEAAAFATAASAGASTFTDAEGSMAPAADDSFFGKVARARRCRL